MILWFECRSLWKSSVRNSSDYNHWHNTCTNKTSWWFLIIGLNSLRGAWLIELINSFFQMGIFCLEFSNFSIIFVWLNKWDIFIPFVELEVKVVINGKTINLTFFNEFVMLPDLPLFIIVIQNYCNSTINASIDTRDTFRFHNRKINIPAILSLIVLHFHIVSSISCDILIKSLTEDSTFIWSQINTSKGSGWHVLCSHSCMRTSSKHVII